MASLSNLAGYRTSVAGTLLYERQGRPAQSDAMLVEVISDGGIVLSSAALGEGTRVRLTLAGFATDPLAGTIVGNAGDDGTGYRLLVKLEQSWPYTVFSQLAMLATSASTPPSRTRPATTHETPAAETPSPSMAPTRPATPPPVAWGQPVQHEPLPAAHTPRPVPMPACLQAMGLSMPCTLEQIEQAFRREVRRVHPDRGGSVEEFVKLRAAYVQALAMFGGSR